MSADQFLDKLEQEGLLEPQVVMKLRAQVAKATSTVSPQTIAKLLIEKGQLTSYQAKKLLESDGREKSRAAPKKTSDELELASKQEEPTEEVVDLAPADKPKKKGGATPPPPPTTKKKKSTSAPKKSKKRAQDATTKQSSPAPAAMGSVADTSAGEVDDGLVPLDDTDLVSMDDAMAGGLQPLDSLGAGYDPFAAAASAESMTPLGAPGDAAAAGAEFGFESKKRRENVWDSPWLLIGGCSLLLILIVGGVLFFVLTRASAGDLWDAAEESYKGGSYAEAVERYTDFVDDFPDHDNAPKARVRRALARLWMPYTSKNWDATLTAAKKHLPPIEKDLGDDPDARSELATILPGMAGGFADQAKDAGRDAARAQIYYDQAQEAMKLVSNSIYIPTNLQENPAIKNVITRIKDDLGIVLRGIQREQRLVAVVKQMSTLAREGKTADAFQLRKELLQDYPGLEGDETLVQAVKDVAGRERDLVKTLEQVAASSQQDHPTRPSTVFASLTGKKMDSLLDRVVVVLVRGSHYGLEVGTGRVLWRRFVGYDTKTHPVRVSPDRGADVLLVDGLRNEVLRVSAKDGQLRWRLPVGEPFADPVVATDFILVPTESGKLIQVDPATGESRLSAKLPDNQSIHIGPGFQEGKPYLYQTGTHDNLYIISASEMKCRDVFYLGHKSGTIAVPPVLFREQILVIENSEAANSVLRVFESEQRGLKLAELQEPIPLVGHVVQPPIVMNDKVLVATKLGAVYVFEQDLSSRRDKIPLKSSATFGKRFDDPVVGYPAVSGFHVWVGDSRLTKFEYQPALEKLESIWLRNQGDAYIGPLHVFANAVISVRRRRGEMGITVAATDGISGDPIWQTNLGVPMAGDLAVVDGELTAVSAQAKLFKANDVTLKAPYHDQATFRLNVDKAGLALEHRVDFGDGRMVFTGPAGGTEFLSYYPADTERPLRLVPTQIRGKMAAAPIAFQGQLLVPASDGLVYCLDPRTGKPSAIKPFHPPLEAGTNIAWQNPTLIGDGKQQFLIADSRGIIYLVQVDSAPEPHLDSVKSAQTQAAIVAPPAASANVVYVAIRGGAADMIVSYALPNLKSHKQEILDGRVRWGPHRIGDKVLVATDGEGLICFGKDATKAWTAPLPYGEVVGLPLALPDGDDLVLASQNGIVWRISGKTGEETGKDDVQEQLATGPIFFGSELVVGGTDGVIHMLPVPKPSTTGTTP